MESGYLRKLDPGFEGSQVVYKNVMLQSVQHSLSERMGLWQYVMEDEQPSQRTVKSKRLLRYTVMVPGLVLPVNKFEIFWSRFTCADEFTGVMVPEVQIARTNAYIPFELQFKHLIDQDIDRFVPVYIRFGNLARSFSITCQH